MKQYKKRLFDIFKFKNLLFESIIISFIIVSMDVFNLPSLIIKNNGLFLLILISFDILFSNSSQTFKISSLVHFLFSKLSSTSAKITSASPKKKKKYHNSQHILSH